MNPVEKKIGKSPCFKRNYTLFGNKSGEGAKQINKFEICEIVGKCYDEKLNKYLCEIMLDVISTWDPVASDG